MVAVFKKEKGHVQFKKNVLVIVISQKIAGNNNVVSDKFLILYNLYCLLILFDL